MSGAESPTLHASRAVALPPQSGIATPVLGMLLFIASEVMFFGGLFAAYFNARATVGIADWHPPAHGHLDYTLAFVLTGILLTSSLTMQLGVWAIRRGDQAKLQIWVAISLVLGVLFMLGQLYDYSTVGFGLADGIYGTTFYTLTGFHGAHVFGGAVGLTILLARAVGGQFSARNHVAVEAISLYWHFVDVVWIGVLSTIFLLPLLG